MLSGLETRSLGQHIRHKVVYSLVTVCPSRSSVHRFQGIHVTCSRPQRKAHRPGFEPRTPWPEIRRPNHCATPPLTVVNVNAKFRQKLISISVAHSQKNEFEKRSLITLFKCIISIFFNDRNNTRASLFKRDTQLSGKLFYLMALCNKTIYIRCLLLFNDENPSS